MTTPNRWGLELGKAGPGGMAGRKFEQVEDEQTPLHDFEKSDLEGTYLGAVLTNTKFGEKNLYSFKLDDGATVAVFGRAMLDRLLSKIEVGDFVKIVETGKTLKTKGGGKVTEFELYKGV